MRKTYWKYILFIYTIINLSLFNYRPLAENNIFFNIIKIVNYLPLVLLIFVFFKNKNIRQGYFSKPVYLFIWGMLLSMIMAFVYYRQDILSSLMGFHVFMPYIVYVVFVQLKIKKTDVELLVKSIFWITLLIFTADIFTFPDTMFAWRSEERIDRNTFMAIFYGQGFTVLGALMYLEKFISTFRIKYLVPYVIASLFIIFLTGSRTYFLGIVVATVIVLIIYFMNNKMSFKATLIIIFVTIISLVSISYLESYVSSLINITNEQLAGYENDIRYDAMKYYSTSFQKSDLTKIFGNGYPYYKSDLGKEISTANFMGYYESDLGLFGQWIYFGILSVIAWILFYYKAFNLKAAKYNIFIVGYFIFLLVNSFLVYTPFDPGYILATICAMYLYKPVRKKTNFISNK